MEQRVYETTKPRKFKLLVRHLTEMNPYMAVVFCNTREEAHEIAGKLQEETDFVVDEIHGDMSQGQRNQVIREFEKAKPRFSWPRILQPGGWMWKALPTYSTMIFPEIWNTMSTASAAPEEQEQRVLPLPMPPLKMGVSFENWKIHFRNHYPLR